MSPAMQVPPADRRPFCVAKLEAMRFAERLSTDRAAAITGRVCCGVGELSLDTAGWRSRAGSRSRQMSGDRQPVQHGVALAKSELATYPVFSRGSGIECHFAVLKRRRNRPSAERAFDDGRSGWTTSVIPPQTILPIA